MTESQYQCPVCHKWYTWAGNFCGLMLAYEDKQPFVCNDCEAEGERLNQRFLELWEAQVAPVWQAARRQWPTMPERPAIFPMPSDEELLETQINHLDTGEVEIERVEAVMVDKYRMAYSPKTHTLAIWDWEHPSIDLTAL